MKTVVSVSLGSSKRDHEVGLDLFGERFLIRREGTDGDVDRAVRLLKELDGSVDALGLGGANMTLNAAGRTWWFHHGKRFARSCVQTTLVDGSGLKGAVEADVVRAMAEDHGLALEGKRVLVCSAADRWGMTEGFLDAGCEVAAADMLFALRTGGPVTGRVNIERMVRRVAPIIVREPLSWRGPDRDHVAVPEPGLKHADLYRDADIVAGDYGQVVRWMPEDMAGKWVVTNTTTAEDVTFLKDRGVELLVTTTPRIKGRTFGANVIEATLMALEGAREPLIAGRYLQLLRAVGFKPDVLRLQHDLAEG